MVTIPGIFRLVPGQQLEADGGECLKTAGHHPVDRDRGTQGVIIVMMMIITGCVSGSQ